MAGSESPFVEVRSAHNREAHLWGIQRGLDLIELGGTVYVEAGSAVDRDGRLVVLQSRERLDFPRKFLLHGSNRLEVSIAHGDNPLEGIIEIGPPRSSSEPSIITPPVVIGYVDLVGGVSNPSYVVDGSSRVYAGVRANRLVSDQIPGAGGGPGSWLELDGSSAQPSITLLPAGAGPTAGIRMTAVDLDVPGDLSVAERLSVRGTIELEAQTGAPQVHAGTAAFSVADDALQLHTGGLKLQIGSFSPLTSSFESVVVVDQGAVDVKGNMTITGSVIAPNKNERELTERAKRYIATMNQVGAAGGQVTDKATFVAVVRFLVELALQNQANKWLLTMVGQAIDRLPAADSTAVAKQALNHVVSDPAANTPFADVVDAAIDAATKTPADEWLDLLVVDSVAAITRKSTLAKTVAALVTLLDNKPTTWTEEVLDALLDWIAARGRIETTAEQLFQRIDSAALLGAVAAKLKAREAQLGLNHVVCPP